MDLRSMFDQWATVTKSRYVSKQWLLSKWENSDGIDWPKEKVQCMIETIAQGLELRSTDILADLGCGGGWISEVLRPHVKKVIGLDFSYGMLANALIHSPGSSFLCGEIGKLPMRADVFERVLCYFVFNNLMDDTYVQQAVLDIYRVMKKGGRALIGQLPDQQGSGDYDEAKKAYLEFYSSEKKLGENYRKVCRFPQKLYDRAQLTDFLTKEKIRFCFRDSFNPFYRPGQPETVKWRFDLILEKS